MEGHVEGRVPRRGQRQGAVRDRRGRSEQRRPSDIVLGYTIGPHAIFFNNGTGAQFTRVTFGDAGSAYGFASAT
jgi:hypothetical protein